MIENDRYYRRYVKDVKSGYIFLQIGKVTLNNGRDLRSKGDHKTSYWGSCGKRQIGWLNNDYKVKPGKQVIEHINCF